jgi:hypothetical protein
VPIAYDRAKSGPDAFKIGTWSAKIGKEFKTSLAGFLQVGSAKLDAVLKVKVSGTAEIGPDYAKALAAIGKQLPESVAKAFLEKAAPEIAKDEARTFTQQLMKEVVESETAHIADEAVRKQVQKHAEAELAEHIAKKELELELAKKSSFFIQRELMEEASKELSVVAIRAKASSIVAREAIPLVTQLRPAITLMVRQAAKRISLKAMAKNAAKALIPGPADMVLVVPEILYHLFDTLMKDYELKRVGLMASECRDNYVGGYTEALRAKTVGGATTGGAGNLQGTSYALGLTDGAKQLDAVLATFLGQQPDATPEEARAEVGEVMQGTAIDRTAIVAAAQPKLRDILLKSYEKQFSGGVARWLFGDGDFKESKQYDAFLREIDHHLSPSPDKYEVANLANGVKVTLVPLEGIDIRNKWFRTLDGKHSNVSIGGDTSTHSGWITEDGRPLEDVYPSQDAADATGTVGLRRNSWKSSSEGTPEIEAEVMAKRKPLKEPFTVTAPARSWPRSVSSRFFAASSVPVASAASWEG